MVEIKALKNVKPNDIIYAYKNKAIVAYKVVRFSHHCELKSYLFAYDSVCVISAETHTEEVLRLSPDKFFYSIEDCILQKNAIEIIPLNKYKILKTLRSQGYEVKIDDVNNFIKIKFYYMSSVGKVAHETCRLEFEDDIKLTYTDEFDINVYHTKRFVDTIYKTATECAQNNEFTIHTF